MTEIKTLFGRPVMYQQWEDLKLWEEVIELVFAQMHWIIEFGTWQGGMSEFLGTQAYSRGRAFYTFDINAPERPTPGFKEWNVFKGWPDLFTMPTTNPGILFCDNGDKPREVDLYKDLIHPECIIAVHDWGTEFNSKDIPDNFRIFRQSQRTVFIGRNDYLDKLEQSDPLASMKAAGIIH